MAVADAPVGAEEGGRVDGSTVTEVGDEPWMTVRRNRVGMERASCALAGRMRTARQRRKQ